MRRTTSHAWQLLAGTLLSLCASMALADDSEIFIQKEVSGGAANLMLILDSSGSMHNVAVTTSTDVVKPYNSTLSYTDYDADCESDSVYYRADDPLNTTPPTSCAGLTRLKLNINNCTDGNCNQCAAATNLEWGKGWTTGRTGSYQDYFIRWRGTTGSNRTWSPNLTTGSSTSSGRDIECKADRGSHGSNDSGTNRYPRPGPDDEVSSRWGGSNRSWWDVAGNTGFHVILWSPNRIRYEGHPATTVTEDQSRMEVVKQAAVTLLDSPLLTGMNVGLMRYSSNGEGGMLLWPISPLTDTSREALKDLINGIIEAGGTPLSETLYEAHQYFAGREVYYGDTSEVCIDNQANDNAGGDTYCEDDTTADIDYPSHPDSIVSDSNPQRYIGPEYAECQNNYIVFLTDGMPTGDGTQERESRFHPWVWDGEGVRKEIEALDQWDELDLECDTTRGPEAGQCFVAMSGYLNKADLSDVDGLQSVRTFYIGFGDEFAGNLADGPFEFLTRAAKAGGGEAFQAGDLPQLEGAFNSILASVTDTNTTFSAPTVAVNAFNRTQTLNDLYVAVFQPSTARHWPGNLKKYRLNEGEIFDKNGNPAVNPAEGFFDEDAHSFWSETKDGYEVRAGGAANLIPDPEDRVVYTYVGDNTPSSAVGLAGTHEFVADYFADPNTTFAIGNDGDPSAADLINWARGQDVRDLEPNNTDFEEARHVMGDPMHTQPAVVIYSGSEDDPDAVVFLPTNDGYLHAIDTDTGVELWSFIPQEVLPQLKHLYANENIDTKQYLLDGEVRVLKFDVDGDGIVESGDRVFIYFSQGRGGQHYYALEVTDKDEPKFMWSLGPKDADGNGELDGVGQTWSPPVITRVRVGDDSDQNSQKLALVFAGGYDIAEESEEFVASDSQGNRIYIVDALYGNVLWWAGAESSTANLKLEHMTHSIPSRVSVLDTNQDGYADRMYVGDMGGQLWRFDLFNGTATTEVEADDFALGGVIASLGGKVDGASATADARRFFNAPDVAALQTDRDPPYLNITIGSGHRGRPMSEVTDDRLYSIRDYIPFRAMTAEEYGDLNEDPIVDVDLQDITEDVNPTIAVDSPGWKLRLSGGEKVLAESTTFDGTVFFVTYTGSVEASAETCIQNSAGAGSNKAYMVSAKNGAPVKDLRDTTTPGEDETDPDAGDGDLTVEDRSVDLEQGGIASGVTFLFPEPNKLVCLSGVEVLGACTDFKSRVKTYWREAGGI